MKYLSYFTKAFDLMPNEFTSHEFASQLRKVKPETIHIPQVSDYLNTVCDRTGFQHKNRTWRKKGVQIATSATPPMLEPTIEYCIQRCKDAGLSVRKIEQKFIEL